MIVGFARYSRDRSFVVLRENLRFVVVMAVGSIVGSFVGGQLLGWVAVRDPPSRADRDSGHVGDQGLAPQIAAAAMVLDSGEKFPSPPSRRDA